MQNCVNGLKGESFDEKYTHIRKRIQELLVDDLNLEELK